jgi:hypothetical protein
MGIIGDATKYEYNDGERSLDHALSSAAGQAAASTSAGRIFSTVHPRGAALRRPAK